MLSKESVLNLKEEYCGKAIQLYPNDTYSKYGVIRDVNELGWEILITKSNDKSHYISGDIYFISHNDNLKMRFV